MRSIHDQQRAIPQLDQRRLTIAGRLLRVRHDDVAHCRHWWSFGGMQRWQRGEQQGGEE
jgi:hypothetical protein